MHLGVFLQMAFLCLYLIAIKIFLRLISFECLFTKPVSFSSLKLKINVYTENQKRWKLRVDSQIEKKITQFSLIIP